MTVTAAQAVEILRSRGARVATAESLTGGLLCATLVDVPGASDVVVGSVVAYDVQVKVEVLGVDAGVVLEHGTVSAETARQMARGAARLMPAATVAVATTGVAGPDPSEGHPVGTVFIAVADRHGVQVQRLALAGDRGMVRRRTVEAAMSLVVARVREEPDDAGR